MKKIVSLVVFVAALAWTWNVIHSTDAIGFETHSGIQAKLAELIQQTLSTKKPTAKDLAITRLWTEPLGENKVRAVFSYKFTEPSENGESLDQVIEGEAVLHREPSETPNVDKWILQSVKTTNDMVVFSEGSTLTSGDSEEPPPAEATPSPTASPSPSPTPAPAEKK
ncbi:hypothetical protein D3C87_1191500 [compost metagenome]